MEGFSASRWYTFQFDDVKQRPDITFGGEGALVYVRRAYLCELLADTNQNTLPFRMSKSLQYALEKLQQYPMILNRIQAGCPPWKRIISQPAVTDSVSERNPILYTCSATQLVDSWGVPPLCDPGFNVCRLEHHIQKLKLNID
jgi:hypothetical protein